MNFYPFNKPRLLISHSKYIIAQKQIQAQLRGVRKAIALAEEARADLIPSEEWLEYVRQLQIKEACMKTALGDLDKIPRKGKRWWDNWIIKLYDWSTAGRFE